MLFELVNIFDVAQLEDLGDFRFKAILSLDESLPAGNMIQALILPQVLNIFRELLNENLQSLLSLNMLI
jgi:hypothetical protein